VISEQLVDLSRLQFAAMALYHFLFLPLTLGMVWLLVIMEVHRAVLPSTQAGRRRRRNPPSVLNAQHLPH
jgi:hypothetical protein